MEKKTHRELVQYLYNEVLSKTPSPDLTERMAAVLAPNWESIGDYSGAKKSREAFGAQLAGFGKIIPDLTWKIEDLLEVSGGFVVRGRATGTPKGDFFGLPPTGKRFEIMSFDYHTIENDKIVRTLHVEDWAGAMRQLKG